MKRFCSFLLVVLTLIGISLSNLSATAAHLTLDGKGLLRGDIDKDGNISIMDTTNIQRYIAEKIPNL